MIPFVSVDDVKTRMALPVTLDGVEPIIVSGLNAAYEYVQGRLNSVFARATYADVFFLDDTMAGGVTPNGFWKLRLATGLIDSSQPVTVTYADASDMGSPTAFTGPVKVDYERGVLSLPRGSARFSRRNLWDSPVLGVPAGLYVQVSYTAGFVVTGALNAPKTITPAPPSWLKEALLAYVPAVFQFQQPTNQDASAGALVESSMEHLNSILDVHSRTGVSFYLNPVY